MLPMHFIAGRQMSAIKKCRHDAQIEQPNQKAKSPVTWTGLFA
jgi:hypothetical protein